MLRCTETVVVIYGSQKPYKVFPLVPQIFLPQIPVNLCFWMARDCLVWRDTETAFALGLYIHAPDLITAEQNEKLEQNSFTIQ